MVEEAALPAPFKEALDALRSKYGSGVRVDAVRDNWAYVWLPSVRFDASRFPEPHERGLWARIPLQFPQANPHGIVTKEPINPNDHHTVKGQNVDHDTAAPVRDLGGHYYYSWTWSGQEYGQGPRLQVPKDVMEVVPWIERRIRLA